VARPRQPGGRTALEGCGDRFAVRYLPRDRAVTRRHLPVLGRNARGWRFGERQREARHERGTRIECGVGEHLNEHPASLRALAQSRTSACPRLPPRPPGGAPPPAEGPPPAREAVG